MRGGERARVLSLFWNFTVGGVAQYAAILEGVSTHSPICIRSFCVLGPSHHANHALLDQLSDKIVVYRSAAWDVAWIGRLREQLRIWRPDIVISHGFNSHFMAQVAALVSDRPFRAVCSYHGMYYAPTPSRRIVEGLYNRFTEYYIRRKACSTVAVADYSRNCLVDQGVAPERVEVIHNGIPDSACVKWGETGLREEWGVASDETLIGVVSRLDPIKGVSYLVEAFGRIARLHPNVKLALIGSGSLDHVLRAQVESYGLSARVVFTGFRADIVSCLSAVDIFVLPSLVENHSISLLEAMRAGKPIVATEVGGNTESARHEREALIVPPANSDAIADALCRLLADPELRNRLGVEARARYLAEFTEGRMIERTAEWLMRVASQPLPCR